MGEFFQGWRRKTGCVTLVIALTFTALWVRSMTTLDYVTSTGSFNRYEWRSCNGVFCYFDVEHGQVAGPHIRGRYFWEHCEITEFDITKDFFMPWDRWAVYYFSAQEPQKQFGFHVWYSLIVVPMTLLSGVLLLIKLRKRKQIQSPNGTALCQPRTAAWEHGPSL